MMEEFHQLVSRIRMEQSSIQLVSRIRMEESHPACEQDQDGTEFHQLASRIRMEEFHPAHKLSANLYNIYHCCAYSEKLLMMDRGTVRNM
jgi:hypothetical protein